MIQLWFSNYQISVFGGFWTTKIRALIQDSAILVQYQPDICFWWFLEVFGQPRPELFSKMTQFWFSTHQILVCGGFWPTKTRALTQYDSIVIQQLPTTCFWWFLDNQDLSSFPRWSNLSVVTTRLNQMIFIQPRPELLSKIIQFWFSNHQILWPNGSATTRLDQMVLGLQRQEFFSKMTPFWFFNHLFLVIFREPRPELFSKVIQF